MSRLAEPQAQPRVLVDGEPTPLVLSLARTLRESASDPGLAAELDTLTGALALRLEDGQVATVRFADGGVHVRHGIADGVDVVALQADPEYTITEGSGPLADALTRLLDPPLPPWRDAATSFWSINQSAPGFPSRLVVVCTDDGEELVLGEGPDTYEIHGSADALAAVLTGRGDSFLLVVASGAITVVGGVGQLSVMCGAHWKVRFGG